MHITNAKQRNNYSIPIKDTHTLNLFLELVVKHMEKRGCGYQILSSMIIPDREKVLNARGEAIDLSYEREKIEGRLKRLKYNNNATIKDERTLKWLWDYFSSIGIYEENLNRFVDGSVQYNFVVQYVQYCSQLSKKTFSVNENLNGLISQGKNCFVIDVNTSGIEAYTFLKFYTTKHESIYKVAIINMDKDFLFNPSAEDAHIGSTQFSYLVMQTSNFGLLFLGNNIRKVYFNIALAFDGYIDSDLPVGRLINDVFQMTSVMTGPKNYFSEDEWSLELDYYSELILMPDFIKKRLEDGKLDTFNRALKYLDKIDEKMP